MKSPLDCVFDIESILLDFKVEFKAPGATVVLRLNFFYEKAFKRLPLLIKPLGKLENGLISALLPESARGLPTFMVILLYILGSPLIEGLLEDCLVLGLLGDLSIFGDSSLAPRRIKGLSFAD